MLPREIADLVSSVQQLIFHTGWEDNPYSFHGTVFFAGLNRRAFVVTARHCVIADGQSSLMPLCIAPNDKSNSCMPLREHALVPASEFVDELGDIAIAEIDMARVNVETIKVNVIDLDMSYGEWRSAATSSWFLIVGYPNEHSNIDNDRNVISSQKFLLKGKYLGQSKNTLLHEVEVLDAHGLRSFDGFSGSPVFIITDNGQGHNDIAFCGIARTGTTTNKRMHFVDRDYLRLAIRKWCDKNP